GCPLEPTPPHHLHIRPGTAVASHDVRPVPACPTWPVRSRDHAGRTPRPAPRATPSRAAPTVVGRVQAPRSAIIRMPPTATVGVPRRARVAVPAPGLTATLPCSGHVAGYATASRHVRPRGTPEAAGRASAGSLPALPGTSRSLRPRPC